MGGVDLADQIRLHCNSTLKGLHRWWLKLFFYQLDVGTSNALVLYNQATNRSESIVNFKKEIIKAFVGHKLEIVIPREPRVEHTLIRGEACRTCVYCQMFKILLFSSKLYASSVSIQS
jgi:hypothetical protein